MTAAKRRYRPYLPSTPPPRDESTVVKTLVNCLGWCHKKFLSTDPVNIRYCPKCRYLRDRKAQELSHIAFNIVETDHSRKLLKKLER